MAVILSFGTDLPHMGGVMNSSLFAADRLTHVKIAIVAIAASLIFILAGLNAEMGSNKVVAIHSEAVIPLSSVARESVKPVLKRSAPGHDGWV